MRTAALLLILTPLAVSCASLLGIEEGTRANQSTGGAGGNGEAGAPTGVGGGLGGNVGVGGGGTCDEPVVGVEDVTVIVDGNEQWLDVVATHPDHGMVVAGRYDDAFAFGGLVSSTGSHCFVAWLNDDGDVETAVPLLTGPDPDEFCQVHDVAIDSAGLVTVVGEFSGTLTADNATKNGQRARDGFVLQVDSTGSVMWFHQFYSGLTPLRVKAVLIDPSDDSIWFGGDYDGEVISEGMEIHSGNAPANGPDVFIAHYDVLGDPMSWSSLLGAGTQTLEAMVLSDDGSLVVGGTFEGAAWAIPNKTPDRIDGWFARITILGTAAPTIHWIRTVQGEGMSDDRIDALAIGPNGRVFAAGNAAATQFEPGASGQVFEFPDNGGFVVEVDNDIGAYLWVIPILAKPDTASVTLSDLVVGQRQEIFVAGIIVAGTSLLAGNDEIAASTGAGFGFVGRTDFDGEWLDAIVVTAANGGSPVSSLAQHGCDVWCAATFGASATDRHVFRKNTTPIVQPMGVAMDYTLIRFHAAAPEP